MKYSVFVLSAIALVAGCFNPSIREAGFACSGNGDGQCPTGFHCYSGRCVDQNFTPPPVTVDMTSATSNEDMSIAPSSSPDMARKMASVDLSLTPVVDMTPPPPPPRDMVVVNTCSHSPCKSGGALNDTCSTCVNEFCNDSLANGGDSYCCAAQWDSFCVSEYKSYTCHTC